MASLRALRLPGGDFDGLHPYHHLLVASVRSNPRRCAGLSLGNYCFKLQLVTQTGRDKVPITGWEYIIGDFSAADILLGYACYMSRRLLAGLSPRLADLNAYVDRIEQRTAFQAGINA